MIIYYQINLSPSLSAATGTLQGDHTPLVRDGLFASCVLEQPAAEEERREVHGVPSMPAD